MSAISAVVQVDFQGESLDAVRNAGGVWVSLRRVCECLSVDFSGQLKKLKGESWAALSKMRSLSDDGKRRPMTVVSLETAERMREALDVRRTRHGRSVLPIRLYFIHSAVAALVKIGCSKNVERRFAGLATMSPTPVRLIGSVACGVEDERAVHDRFAWFRHHGEWFSYKGCLAAWVKECVAAGSLLPLPLPAIS